MKKDKNFRETRFGPEVLREAKDSISKIAVSRGANAEDCLVFMKCQTADATWRYDALEEFFADFRSTELSALFSITYRGVRGFRETALSVLVTERDSNVEVTADNRSEIEEVFAVFEKHQPSFRIAPQKPSPAAPVVFIGHGRSPLWRELKDHLSDKHGIQVQCYESGARAGHAIRDILEDLASKTSFAILILTGEDEQADGGTRARQNVIHEAGLFQGRLGFSKAIMLLEDGVEMFSNAHGIQYIPFTKSNIKETFGEVLATISREFPRGDRPA